MCEKCLIGLLVGGTPGGAPKLGSGGAPGDRVFFLKGTYEKCLIGPFVGGTPGEAPKSGSGGPPGDRVFFIKGPSPSEKSSFGAK